MKICPKCGSDNTASTGSPCGDDEVQNHCFGCKYDWRV